MRYHKGLFRAIMRSYSQTARTMIRNLRVSEICIKICQLQLPSIIDQNSVKLLCNQIWGLLVLPSKDISPERNIKDANRSYNVSKISHTTRDSCTSSRTFRREKSLIEVPIDCPRLCCNNRVRRKRNDFFPKLFPGLFTIESINKWDSYLQRWIWHPHNASDHLTRLEWIKTATESFQTTHILPRSGDS